MAEPTPSPDSADALRAAANVVRLQAVQVRQAFQRNYDAADPTPGDPEAKRLADVLELAASQRGPERAATFQSRLSGDDVQALGKLAEVLARPALPTDPAEDAARASVLPSVRAALATVVAARGQVSPGAA